MLGSVEGGAVNHSLTANSSPARLSSAPLLAGNCQMSVQKVAEGGRGGCVIYKKYILGLHPRIWHRASNTLDISGESYKGVSCYANKVTFEGF